MPESMHVWVTMANIMGSAAEVLSSARYEFKPGPYSSHGLLISLLPESGGGRRVLDVGCGDGHVARILLRRGYEVTGIDSSEGSEAEFRRIQADLDNGLPALSHQFDFILCADILEHLRDPLGFLRRLKTSLRPGGCILASLPNSGHAYFRWNVLIGRFPEHDRGLFDRTHLHFYTWVGWERLLARAGLSVQALRCSGVPISLALPRWKESRLVKYLEQFSFLSARVWKRMFAYQFVVVVRPQQEVWR